MPESITWWGFLQLYTWKRIEKNSAKKRGGREFPASAGEAWVADRRRRYSWNEIMWLSGCRGVKGLALNGKSCWQDKWKRKLLETYYGQQWSPPGRWGGACRPRASPWVTCERATLKFCLPVRSYSISPLLPDEMWNCLLSIQGPSLKGIFGSPRIWLFHHSALNINGH